MSKKSNKALINQLRKKGIRNEQVLNAMLNHPREQFVTEATLDQAYEDHPLSIGHQQTLSQPYLVAFMTEVLINKRERLKKVLEIGTGSGYQAAILSDLADDVYTIERIEALYQSAKMRCSKLGLENVHCLYKDGHEGHSEESPYDGIIVTCAVDESPEALLDQLTFGGRLVIPINESDTHQVLYMIESAENSFQATRLMDVRFVPFLKGTS